jgi:hypothetical protein
MMVVPRVVDNALLLSFDTDGSAIPTFCRRDPEEAARIESGWSQCRLKCGLVRMPAETPLRGWKCRADR